MCESGLAVIKQTPAGLQAHAGISVRCTDVNGGLCELYCRSI